MKFNKNFEKNFVQTQEKYIDVFTQNMVLSDIENECINKVLENNIFLDKRGNRIVNYKQSFRIMSNDADNFKILLLQEKINYGLNSEELNSKNKITKELETLESNLFNLGLNTIPVNQRNELTEIFNNDINKRYEILNLMSKVNLKDIKEGVM